MPRFNCISLILLWLMCSGITQCSAQSSRSDASARMEIFGSEALQNTLAFYEHLTVLPASLRYEQLRDNVFPRDTRFIRIEYASAPVSWKCPCPIQIPAANATFQTQGDISIESALPPAELLVPAVSLIDIARQLDRLPEIETLLTNRAAHAENSESDVLILRSLLAIARGRHDEASEKMIRLSTILEAEQLEQLAIGGVLALIWKARPIASLRDSTMSLGFRCYELARAGDSHLDEVWKRHCFTTHYLLQSLADDRSATAPHKAAEARARWRPVSRSTPQSAGQGYPAAMWRLAPGQASKIGTCDRDFLYFDVPLTGNFAVEALVSAFNYHETQLGYGGTWAGPAYDHTTLLRGHFASDRSTLTLAPPLDEITDPMRVRLEVHDGITTTFINGRQVNQAPISASDPWLTIFSNWYTHGWVKNLKILGDPKIPDSIDLLADKRLLGWDAHYGTSRSEEADWELAESMVNGEAGGTPMYVLHGERHDIVQGSYCERLLRYHRPIFEDADLSYEFYYRTGSNGVHPSINGRAYILDADANVVVHEITDGIYERSSRRPHPPRSTANQIVSPGASFRNNAWNRMDIQIRGDQIQLSLNGGLICERHLEEGLPRFFGLFHYCDQTEVLVRNLRWTGGWPKALDAVQPQQLVDRTLENTLAELQTEQIFRHEFADGLPLENFGISGEGWKQNLTQEEDGIRLVRPGGDFVQYTIVPNLQLDGDFDVLAEFADFDAAIASGGDASIQLVLGFSENATDFRLYRKFSRYAQKELGQQIVQAAYFYTRGGNRIYEFPRSTSEAATGGKLRFSRRGDQLHYLFAANGSDYYRLLHTESAPRGPTRPNGIALMIETTKAGQATVTWKSLEVRAQQLAGKALEASLSLEQLNESRDSLPQAVNLDFAAPSVRDRIESWGTDATFRYVREGLLVTAPGFKTWHGHGLFPRLSVHGDFDIRLEMEIQHIEPPQAGGECVVYLEAIFQGSRKTSIQTKYAMSPSGAKTGELTHRMLLDTGEMDYQELVHYPLESVHALRIARRDKTAYVLIQESPTSDPLVLGRVDVEDTPVAVGDLHAVLHTAGVGRKTVALLKRMSIQADAIQE